MPASGKILVTGGAGFIGANFVLDWLRETGDSVVNLDKLTYAGNMENMARCDGISNIRNGWPMCKAGRIGNGSRSSTAHDDG